MIILSKVLPFFLMPLGVTTALVLAGILLRRRLLCLAGILVRWVAAMPVTSDPFMRMIEGHAVRMAAEDMPGADAIVVLSGGRVTAPGEEHGSGSRGRGPNAAEAMGARYGRKGGVHAGKGAKAAVFSFNGNKIMTTSGGGMLASDDKALIDRARFLSQQARDPVPHYEHTEIGFNYRMSNVLAAIGRGQLAVLDERVQRRREIFAYYRKALEGVPGIEFMPEADYGRANRWLSVILITPEQFGADREAVRLALEAENIESRPVWKPMHLQPVFQTTHPCRVVGGSVSQDLFTRGLCLPSGTAMTEEDQDRVIDTILGVRPALL